LIILVAWEIWKHRNTCVFDNKRPSVQEVLRTISAKGGGGAIQCLLKLNARGCLVVFVVWVASLFLSV
jgi:hypothetical protein